MGPVEQKGSAGQGTKDLETQGLPWKTGALELYREHGTPLHKLSQPVVTTSPPLWYDQRAGSDGRLWARRGAGGHPEP